MATPPPLPPSNLDDYTSSATLIHFDRPIPLLRGPLRAGPSDNRKTGPFVLAFKDPQSWASSYQSCKSQITQQCEAGARIGCSIAASSKCKTPWWKALIGLAKQDYAERAKCEEREMEACVETSKEKCREFAKNKCSTAFMDARIAVKGLDLVGNRREVAKLLSWVCLDSEKGGDVNEAMKFGSSWVEFRNQFEFASLKGSDLDLLGLSNVNDIDDYVREKS